MIQILQLEEERRLKVERSVLQRKERLNQLVDKLRLEAALVGGFESNCRY
jgi:hypothetical protein